MKSSKSSSPLVLGPSSPVFPGPFKKNLSALFRINGEKVQFTQMKHAWAHMVQVKHKGQDGRETDLKLHFYTEVLSPEYDNIVCDECRIMGWQDHCVGTKRVHVILPSEKTLANPRTLMSLMEMRHRGWMHRARLDASKIAREKEDDTGDGTAEFVAAENMFHSKSHLLHGVFHMNGYGHLCRVNGREGGSSKYTGTELMHVWNELCTVLRARVISVEDVSNKLTMELRILLPISYGQTWYGRWDYSFGRAPFNINAQQWEDAVSKAAGVKIADLIAFCTMQSSAKQSKPRKGWKHVLTVLRRYHLARLLSRPGMTDSGANDKQPVHTIGELLRVMMDALRHPDEELRRLIVSVSGGQNPREKQLLDLKAPQNGEQALIEAYNAQDQPPVTQVMPEVINAVLPKSTSKRPRKDSADDDAPYTPATKRKQASCAASEGETSKKSKSAQKGKKKAARLAEIDTPVGGGTPDGKSSAGGDCKRRLLNRRENSNVAVLAYEGMAEPSSIDAKSGKDAGSNAQDGISGDHDAQDRVLSSRESPSRIALLRPRAARNRQPSLRLLDYDDLAGRPPPARGTLSTSLQKQRRAVSGSSLPAHMGVLATAQPAIPSVSKSGRKRTLTLRAELAAAAEASENGVASPEPSPPTRSIPPKQVASRPSTGSKAQSFRPVSTGKGVTAGKSQSKNSSPDAPAKAQRATPRVRVQSSAQNTPCTALPAPSAAVEVWCENINSLAPGACISQKYATDNSVRNQVMSDLLCLYFALFRTDVSENLIQHFRMLGNVAAASGADLAKPPPPCSNPAVMELRNAMTTLRYTKHFVKDYHGTLPHPSRQVRNINPRPSKKKSLPASPEMRFLVTVLMGFSSEHFGGPEAVAEPGEEEARDSLEEDGKKGYNASALTGVPAPVRQSTRNTRAASARDDLGASPRLAGAKAGASLHAAGDENSPKHPHGSPGRKVPGNDHESSTKEANNDVCTLHALPVSARESSAVPEEVTVAGVNGHVTTEDDGGAPGVRHGQLTQQLEHINQQSAAPQDSFAALSSRITHLDAVLPAQVNGTGLSSLNAQCNHSSADTSIAPPNESHAVKSAMIERMHDICAGELRPGGSCMLSSLGVEKAAAFGSCSCAAARSSLHGCSDMHADLHGVGVELYTTELHAVLNSASALPIHLRPPPAELVVMAGTTSVAEFKRAVSVALRETYHIFSKFQVMWVHCPDLCSNGASPSSSALHASAASTPFVCGHMPADKDKIERHLPCSADNPIRLIVAGPGLDLETANLRHAGGEADWIVSCKCGVQDDDGERMLCCDKCGNWVHGVCEGIGDSEPDPKAFTCYRCRESC